jgi:hypothetical protein
MSDEWTKHDGGSSPVPANTRVVAENENSASAFRQVECEAGLLKWQNVTRWKLA